MYLFSKKHQRFQGKFLKNHNKFAYDKHIICSFDASSLFTSINVTRVIAYVLDIVYLDPEKYFNEQYEDEDGVIHNYDIPPRTIFKQFFHDTLLKYSSFQTVTGYYIQTQGLSMGGRLSPVLADIFCHMMEQKIILKNIEQGNILH